ncbi:hypothetical protein O3P69_004707 [Scylla paramamosain]|uniref:Dehydrogenase/reductase SDR family member 11 n=2 Tax=Scylla paramamosain TaxID=85552 RepID=A0AAW0UG75_SCYPA
MQRWAGRLALVTGASAGIGANLAQRLVTEGMRVVGAARNVETLQVMADKLKDQPGSLVPMQCDLTKDDQVLDMFARIKQDLGGIDVLINNAAMSIFNSGLLESTAEDWRKMLDLNVVALCLCTREAVASMQEHGTDDGHIIHMNSISGHLVYPFLRNHLYSITKHMVTAHTEAVRQALRKGNTNIKISAISPGMVATDFGFRSGMRKEESEKMIQERACLQPEDVTESVIHILSRPPHVQIHDLIMRPTKEKH